MTYEITFTDKFNSNKQWNITQKKNNQFFIKQGIKQVWNGKQVRFTKKHMQELIRDHAVTITSSLKTWLLI